MNKLINIFKQIELDLRTNNDKLLSRNTLNTLYSLNEWEYNVCNDFIIRLKNKIERDDNLPLYKQYMSYNNTSIYTETYDLMICLIKRNEKEFVLTDVYNRLVKPQDITYTIFEVWGYNIIEARNLAIQEALKYGCKDLLFIDNDILAPNNALLKLYEIKNKYDDNKEFDTIAYAGDYYKKIEPFESAHFKTDQIDYNIYKSELCAMGFTLINIDKLCDYISPPYFWSFINKYEKWVLGEDAFFTKRLIYECDSYPLIVENLGLLHYDVKTRRTYGHKLNNELYSGSSLEDTNQFFSIRLPEVIPEVVIGIPTRNKNDKVACDINELSNYLPRGYKSRIKHVYGKKVDESRNLIVDDAIKNNSKYIFFIDDDVKPPRDVLIKMIRYMDLDENNKIGVLSGDYNIKDNTNTSVHLVKVNGELRSIDMIKEDIVDINWMIGLGCALIRTDIFKDFSKPYFKCHSKDITGSDINEDAHFCELVFQNGYSIIVNKNIKCRHIDFKNIK